MYCARWNNVVPLYVKQVGRYLYYTDYFGIGLGLGKGWYHRDIIKKVTKFALHNIERQQ